MELSDDLPDLPTDLVEKYGTPIELLGEGAFGEVVQTSKGFAVKIMGGIADNPLVMLEYSSMKSVKSTYIMRLIDLKITPDNAYLVLPLGVVLPDMVELSQVKDTFLQMCYGVADFHSADMTHQDLKPRNFIRVGDKVLLADFGLTQINVCSNLVPRHLGFTLFWRPPEFLLGKDSTQAGDIWALGVILLSWLIQRQPFTNYEYDEDYDDETNFLISIFKNLGFPTEATWPGVSNFKDYPTLEQLNLPARTQFLKDNISDPIARDLVEKMLSLNPARRPTIYEVLAHPYFNLDLPDKYLNPPGCIDTLLERERTYSKNRITRKNYLSLNVWVGYCYHDLRFSLAAFSYGVSLFNFIDRRLMTNQIQVSMSACLYIGSNLYEYDPLQPDDLTYVSDQAYKEIDLIRKVIDINKTLDYNIIVSHPYAFTRALLQTHGDLDLLELVNKLYLIFLSSSVGRAYSASELGINLYELAKGISNNTPRTEIQMEMIQLLQEDVSKSSLLDLYKALEVSSTYKALIQ